MSVALGNGECYIGGMRRKHGLPDPGHRFGRWTVLDVERPTASGHRRYALCRCECGTESRVLLPNLQKGQSRSCGCLGEANRIARITTHGDFRTPLYHRWLAMKDRCNNPRNQSAYRYHDRGIAVCPEWNADFAMFRDWAVSSGYRPELEIDRINNDGNYEPSNCRWVTRKRNMRNRGINNYITAFGERKCIAEWIEDSRCVVGRHTLDSRLRARWPTERALSEPNHRRTA